MVYKIYCKDPDVKDFYIGSTKDINNRKQRHKNNCNNEKRPHYNIYLYQFIRDHKGWENWNMDIIEEYPCLDNMELVKRERYWYDELKPSLNKYKPYRSKEERREYNKIYSQEHRDKINERRKIRYEKNKDKIREKQKEYGKIKYNCECGSIVRVRDKATHFRTKKHIEFMNSKNLNI